ncbi:hypothetical protein [Ferrovibrio terrae]|uniref:hypothetical protein n=1 Tax=Ferrovibrio terrae TaxID=2594003 RepID=UPI003137F534
MLKYLLLILLVAAVWYGWRYVNRKPASKPPAPTQPAQDKPAPKAVVEDLKPCPVCGTYMVTGPDQPPGQTCGRPECRPA